MLSIINKKKRLFQKLLVGLVLVVLFFGSSLEIAYSAVDPLEKLRETAQTIFDIFFTIGTLLALAFLTYGGVVWATSVGDPQQILRAKEWIHSSLIGLAILLSSGALLHLLGITEKYWLLERLKIPFIEERPEIIRMHPSFCQGINLTKFTGNLKEFLNAKDAEKRVIAGKAGGILNESENFVSDAKRFCNAFFGTWAKCVEYSRQATFIGVTAERLPIAHDLFPQVGLLKSIIEREGRRDGCPQWVREEAKNFSAEIGSEKKYVKTLEKTIDNLSKSEQAKKLEIVLDKLSRCQLDDRTILHTRQQAEELGIIQALNLGNYEFYCCVR